MDTTRQRRILVVDDAVTVRLYCRQVLESAGYVVIEAINGLDGLERLLVTPADLLLVDINMPKMDGYSMLHQLRRTPELRDLPAVMVSTEEKPEDAERAFAAGANFYMAKPIRPDPLVAVIRLVLGEAVR
jgi:two-component system chemotaxis response regulator CheY